MYTIIRCLYKEINEINSHRNANNDVLNKEIALVMGLNASGPVGNGKSSDHL